LEIELKRYDHMGVQVQDQTAVLGHNEDVTNGKMECNQDRDYQRGETGCPSSVEETEAG